MILRLLERATRNCFNLKLCIMHISGCVVCIHAYKYSLNEVKPLGLSILTPPINRLPNKSLSIRHEKSPSELLVRKVQEIPKTIQVFFHCH